MKNPVFRLKQFDVDQTGSGMKVNTDGVILGAIAKHADPENILEIGTGTGIIALMLAQRFPKSAIDAVEIDANAAQCAKLNFQNSAFSARINCFADSFQHYFARSRKTYDLIVCNPPYFIDSLKSDTTSRNISRHTDLGFFSDLIDGMASHLNAEGSCFLIVPLPAAAIVINLCKENSALHLVGKIALKSFADSEPFRNILIINSKPGTWKEEEIVIYESQNVYSTAYKSLLQDFLTIF